MRKSDLRYIKNITTIDAKKVGKKINSGVHHRVYEYGTKHVIKIPRRRYNFLYSTRSHLEADISLINRFFPNLMVKTTVHSSKKHKHHCMVQEKITSFQPITPASFPRVHKEFATLVAQNEKLETRHAASLDFLGGEGFFSCITYLLYGKPLPHFSNMVIIRDKSRYMLKLMDTELLRFSRPGLNTTELVSFGMSLCSLAITKLCLKLFLR
jgi:hypothetical protein